jgi:hypothetical protein
MRILRVTKITIVGETAKNLALGQEETTQTLF